MNSIVKKGAQHNTYIYVFGNQTHKRSILSLRWILLMELPVRALSAR